MSDCETYKPLLAGLLDKELSPEETATINQHLIRCAACRADYEEMRVHMDKLDTVSLVEPEQKTLEGLWSLPYTRTFRNAGWILVIGGYLLILLTGLWQFISSPDEATLPQLSVLAMLVGGVILFGIVLIERIMTYRKDPYKDIER